MPQPTYAAPRVHASAMGLDVFADTHLHGHARAFEKAYAPPGSSNSNSSASSLADAVAPAEWHYDVGVPALHAMLAHPGESCVFDGDAFFDAYLPCQQH